MSLIKRFYKRLKIKWITIHRINKMTSFIKKIARYSPGAVVDLADVFEKTSLEKCSLLSAYCGYYDHREEVQKRIDTDNSKVETLNLCMQSHYNEICPLIIIIDNDSYDMCCNGYMHTLTNSTDRAIKLIGHLENLKKHVKEFG